MRYAISSVIAIILLIVFFGGVPYIITSAVFGPCPWSAAGKIFCFVNVVIVFLLALYIDKINTSRGFK